ncbi:sensor histidine kinase [Breznakibacter xylanolyticus]|uniref:sensor histidine kinase n=1 Tax=Breznakibacter xylanolyticus TaxID=990 RepID=UPI000DAC0ED1|nr:HAMP domain-containing sensor histidine kinase [Breznakibacter xylanolyticus]
MSFYSRKKRWKYFLLLTALFIGGFTLWYTNGLVEIIKQDEHRKMEIWAEAIRVLTVSDGSESAPMMNLINKVIAENRTIPVILIDHAGQVLSYNNLDAGRENDVQYLMKELEAMKHHGDHIFIDLGEGEIQYLYYRDSVLLQQLKWFPMVQMLVVAVFIIVAYMVFSGTRKAEQDQVWVGMAKETAHQLGTPTSSLLAWVDLLKMKQVEPDLVGEMAKDVERLRIITDRFSKIGTQGDMQMLVLSQTIGATLDYLKKRTSSQVHFHLNEGDACYQAFINPVLFEWVIENLCKNALDAMGGKGDITISLSDHKQFVCIDVKDTGKGIPRHRFKTVFQPGYTTKKRGWGLGLTLVKRIVEQYHKGKIFVASSQPGEGSTFRILLRKG